MRATSIHLSTLVALCSYSCICYSWSFAPRRLCDPLSLSSFVETLGSFVKVRFASGREEASLVVSGSGRGPRLELDLCVQLKHPGRRRRSTSRCVRTPTTNLCVLSLFTFHYLALVFASALLFGVFIVCRNISWNTPSLKKSRDSRWGS